MASARCRVSLYYFGGGGTPPPSTLHPTHLAAAAHQCWPPLCCSPLTTCRMAGTRGAQLRQICNDLKRICQHPYMLPEFEPERPEPLASTHPAAGAGSAAAAAAEAAEREYLASLLASSGKLQVLDTMLQQLRAQGKQVMVMAHSPRVGVAGSGCHRRWFVLLLLSCCWTAGHKRGGRGGLVCASLTGTALCSPASASHSLTPHTPHALHYTQHYTPNNNRCLSWLLTMRASSMAQPPTSSQTQPHPQQHATQPYSASTTLLQQRQQQVVQEARVGVSKCVVSRSCT